MNFFLLMLSMLAALSLTVVVLIFECSCLRSALALLTSCMAGIICLYMYKLKVAGPSPMKTGSGS